MSKVVVAILYGLGGAVTSDGIVQLSNEIKQIPNVHVCGPYDETDWESAVKELNRWTVEKLVLIGYSMGANNITYVAQDSKRDIDVLIGIQPTLWSGVAPITKKVGKVLLFNNDGPIGIAQTGGLGARDYTFDSSFKGRYVHKVIRDSHPYADNDPEVHKEILQEIRSLSTA